MLISEIISELQSVQDIHGNMLVSLNIGLDADNITTSIDAPYNFIELIGWIGHDKECLHGKIPQQDLF